MSTFFSKFMEIQFTILISILSSCYFVGISCADSSIYTNKTSYLPGETVQVSFAGAPGNSGDWVCIAPISSPDNQAGEYQYLPHGESSGQLTFSAPNPGQYEARAYFNYKKNGYIVSGRHAFTVKGNGDNVPTSEALPSSPAKKTAADNSGAGIGYVMSELSGSAKPEGGIAESIPEKKKYQTSNTAVWNAVQDVLDEQGYLFIPDSASGRIKTDPKVLGDDQNTVALFAANYSVVVSIKVKDSSVSYKARFNKQSNVVMGGEFLEFPEKENELRKEFFAALDAKLH